ncbi:ATP-binding protein [Mycobacterium hubeiense]|uniref:ATP-binding protein n=1 Tax=Mycobacterium hubeiense TaxID=1867256 RepID=UPI000C7F1E82|nr:ATP-binding protein [Mycobacterium sp. QGD 101]
MGADTSQWRLHSMQLVNWGGFEGHHRVDLSAPATLISGATGTGKSTLLDAYIALLMPSRVPFNGASNDNTTGRARGGDQRNVLRYMRGKIDDDRQAGSDKLTDQVLRGRNAPTWSAIAATWHTEDGQQFSAIRLYYAAPSATRFDDITKRMATIDAPFDLAAVADFAATQFDPPQLRNQFGGLEFHGSYRSFSTTLCIRLGIGLPGEGERALGLLARIQAGRAVTTVDGLFKTMVLERPKTLAVADEAVTHFDDLQASYEAMKTAEQQVETLSPIIDWHRDWCAAQTDVETLDMLGLHADGPTALRVWALRTEQRLVADALHSTASAKADAHTRARAARRDEDDAEAELAALHTAQSGDLTAHLDDLDRRLEHLSSAHRDTEQQLKIYRERTTALAEPPATAEEFAAAQAAAAQFLAEYPRTAAELRARRDTAVGHHHRLHDHRAGLAGELESLSGRSGAIPAELHAARCAVAAAIGRHPDHVPFVGELIDMRPGYEAWRLAADRAMGGFATTLLIAAEDLDHARVQINELSLARRLTFEGAQPGQPIAPVGDEHRLSGRIIVDESSPFAGWVLARIASGFDYVCVDDPAALATVQRGLTITGQTKTGSRGAHGGSRAPVIGFSNTHRGEQLRADLDGVDAELVSAAAAIAAADRDIETLQTRRDAYRYVADTTWSGIDVATARERVEAAAARRDQAATGAGARAGETASRRDQLRTARENAARARHLAEADVERLTAQYAGLQVRGEELAGQIQQLPAGAGEVLTEQLAVRLDTELGAAAGEHVTATTFGQALARLHAALSTQAETARAAAARAAKMLTATFEAFQRQWPRPDLGTDVSSYVGYRDILDDLNAEGLHQRRATFVRDVNDWTGIDLLRLHGAYEEAVEEIAARLDPINNILAELPFGAGADRLHITLRRTATADITAFRKELKTLAGFEAAPGDDEDLVQKRFLTLARFINRIRKSDSTSERDYYLDVRRHIYIEAERRDTHGATLNVYASLAGKSGGESQELIAFIVGAALRYQLGDAQWPRYAPVILDEGFIKSDAAFAGRAVAAWKGLGFQLVIGAPDDKVNSIEPHVDRILCITKNSQHRSHITALTDTTRPS